MKASVEVSGERQELDIDRVRYLDELEGGDEVIAMNPDTRRLCRAGVSFDLNGRCWLRDTERSIAPFRWRINRRSIREGIYKIVD